MKKRLFALLATLILTFAFSVNCFAAASPSVTELPTTKQPTKGNKSHVSPKTGVGVSGAFVAIITASGVALTAKKKYSDAE